MASAHVLAVLFDVGDRESFEGAFDWLRQAVQHAPEGTPIVVVGNKTDLAGRVVATDEAQALCNERSVQYFETSALSGDGVDGLFVAMARLAALKVDKRYKALAGTAHLAAISTRRPPHDTARGLTRVPDVSTSATVRTFRSRASVRVRCGGVGVIASAACGAFASGSRIHAARRRLSLNLHRRTLDIRAALLNTRHVPLSCVWRVVMDSEDVHVAAVCALRSFDDGAVGPFVARFASGQERTKFVLALCDAIGDGCFVRQPVLTSRADFLATYEKAADAVKLPRGSRSAVRAAVGDWVSTHAVSCGNGTGSLGSERTQAHGDVADPDVIVRDATSVVCGYAWVRGKWVTRWRRRWCVAMSLATKAAHTAAIYGFLDPGSLRATHKVELPSVSGDTGTSSVES